eukprot:4705434-Pyramimonas_sp.AAC.1
MSSACEDLLGEAPWLRPGEAPLVVLVVLAAPGVPLLLLSAVSCSCTRQSFSQPASQSVSQTGRQPSSRRRSALRHPSSSQAFFVQTVSSDEMQTRRFAVASNARRALERFERSRFLQLFVVVDVVVDGLDDARRGAHLKAD